ncbi:hypothetical protein DWB77_02084 [Streptomyces hundungensis]|uniref:Uncharacterized protein n=1 Tax=Streptomyces hundungensis TaxID=1077946 RepID=A0A387H812_9ACTN|nr:hypothetical protein [Streptomyces hundungensis]AYG79965.1 hypothetical protein DWB77_02084 [Streptomyces hundungensis]
MLGKKANQIRLLRLEVEMANRTNAHFQKVNNRLNTYIDGLEAELDIAVQEYTELEARYDALTAEREASQADKPPF